MSSGAASHAEQVGGDQDFQLEQLGSAEGLAQHEVRPCRPPGPSSLTGAELRVLPMLATHLSFPEIGADLFLSPNTVKSQAISIYRKLGTCSRSQMVARSRERGLLDR